MQGGRKTTKFELFRVPHPAKTQGTRFEPKKWLLLLLLMQLMWLLYVAATAAAVVDVAVVVVAVDVVMR